jgi:hypothetical protein
VWGPSGAGTSAHPSYPSMRAPACCALTWLPPPLPTLPLLAPQAVERVRLVKPDNARAIEEHVIRLARAGKLADRIDEDTLKRMLEEVSGQAEAAAGAVKKVKIIRKKHADDEDEDDDEDF